MANTRAPSPMRRMGTVVGLLLLVATPWPAARGFPANDRELDSAVEGVQKYLESSGFPKMTRGEVLDFLNDFSRNARVSRSDGGKKDAAAARDKDAQAPTAPSPPPPPPSPDAPRIPAGESPLNYGYPLSAATAAKSDVDAHVAVARGGPKKTAAGPPADVDADAAVAPKKTAAGPPVDVNAYAKFKKIPEGKNLKIDDDMRAFLGGFGLLDDKAGRKPAAAGQALRRADVDANATETVDATTKTADATTKTADATTTETVDAALLKSVLMETGSGGNETAAAAADLSNVLLQESASSSRDHVFNPSDTDVRTVDVNRIAKIVENIRLLAEDNATVSLSQEAIQRKLENITAAIAAIDQQQPAAAAATGKDKPFDGYDVFFDDDTKEVDAEALPDLPTGGSGVEGEGEGGAVGGAADALLQAQRLPLNEAHNPPDPLSTDELQQLLEKNKNDVKRQEPASDADESASSATTTTTTTTTAATTFTGAASATTSDSSSEATSAAEVTSDASAVARDSSTAASADVSPSLSQLAESFGGGETASSPPETAAASPDRPRSGLYFYVDWNSFLTVNEGQKNQVNLRFAPKAGNAAHFIKVNVP